MSSLDSRQCNLKILYFNSNSVLGKLNMIQAQVMLYKPDVICIIGTKICSTFDDNELLGSGYTICRNDRKQGGGGVLMAINNSSNVVLVQSERGPGESVICTLNILSRLTVNLVTFYRPPGEADLVNLADLLTVNDWKHPVMLIGDFNLSDINWSRNKGEIKPSSNRKSFHREALDLFATANLVQFVSGSTHVKGNTLDLLFVEKDLLNDIVVEWEIKPGISDHNMILVGVDLQQYQQCGVKYSGKRTRYNYKKADYVKICEVFRDLNDMAHQNKFSTPGEIWDALKNAIMTCLKKYVPTSLTQPGGKPWMTRTLIRLIKKRGKVYQRQAIPHTGKCELVAFFKTECEAAGEQG